MRTARDNIPRCPFIKLESENFILCLPVGRDGGIRWVCWKQKK
jgi:hypothetical protein